MFASAYSAPQLFGYPYGLSAYSYPYAVPNLIKPVLKEVEVPVKTIQYVAAETGCKNSFGAPVPCARRRREAAEEEAEAAEAPAAVPAVLPYGLPYGLGLGLPYSYASPLTYSVAAPVIKPTVTEVEVPQYKFVPEVQKVELPPACHNGYGWPVPCAV